MYPPRTVITMAKRREKGSPVAARSPWSSYSATMTSGSAVSWIVTLLRLLYRLDHPFQAIGSHRCLGKRLHADEGVEQ
jgi:hypothetical protein